MVRYMKRLLVVDDDPLMGEMAKGFLQNPNTEVHVARSGEEALNLLSGGRFDLIMTDIDMGKLDGLALLRQVRLSPTHAKVAVLVISGRKDLASIDAAHALGAASFVSKPVNWRLLPYKIRAMLSATSDAA
ncbi:response regulator [Alsobacter soli]|uniref:Response regulator n=2 Tax=Alsobacter soli TaxID=2109933 RepID=A0A2T1HXM6_9HYPH|nr:response regulator [Alsobacter soli]